MKRNTLKILFTVGLVLIAVLGWRKINEKLCEKKPSKSEFIKCSCADFVCLQCSCVRKVIEK